MKHSDEISGQYNYCPECGWNAIIYTWPHIFGKSWRCNYCGSFGKIYSSDIKKLMKKSPLYFEFKPEQREE